MKREEILRHPAYWFENEQNEIYSQVTDYMEREGINQTQLAEKLKVGKSYVSQILKGNYNFSLKKWIKLCLAIGIVPAGYKRIEDVIQEDKMFAESKKLLSEKKTKVTSEIGAYTSAAQRINLSIQNSTFGEGYSNDFINLETIRTHDSKRALQQV